ncbi:hypothetical protein TRVA0_005S03840 [Trichomonascus vanleenenianus]|uniref:uncharacterized protein n=1 Tax=Trichomonascus vanleenenianus TaxID=2268995 RepID=UPI003EC9714D
MRSVRFHNEVAIVEPEGRLNGPRREEKRRPLPSPKLTIQTPSPLDFDATPESSPKPLDGSDTSIFSPESFEVPSQPTSPAIADSGEEFQRIQREHQLTFARYEFYDLAMKLERLNLQLNQTICDKAILARKEKQGTTSLMDFGPELCRLIGHTQETLDHKIRFTQLEIKRVRKMMKKIKKRFPEVLQG